MPEQPTCKTCKRWDDSPTWATESGMGFCAVLHETVAVEGVRNAGYALDTPPDFGCILHEPRRE